VTSSTGCRSHAVVVGIERYREPDWNLDGPALDACRMAHWLIENDVPAEQVTALVSPLERNEDAVRRFGLARQLPADRETVHRVFSEELPDQRADMLFVYWVGHGMTYEGDTLLAFADTTFAHKRYLNVRHLMRWLRTTAVRFPRQLILIDACRSYADDLRITAPNCWDFDPVSPAGNLRQEALLAVARGEPSLRPAGSRSTLFTTALHAELGLSSGPCELDAGSLRKRICADPGSQVPTVLIYEGPHGEHEEHRLGPPDVTGGQAEPAPGSSAPRPADLARKLDSVAAMRHAAGRMAFAGDLSVAFGQDLFRIAPVVNRADLSVPEIVRTVSGMTDWPRVIRDVCEFRSDLFPPREQAVADVLAFLDPTRRR
jgi:hypothetical protein